MNLQNYIFLPQILVLLKDQWDFGQELQGKNLVCKIQKDLINLGKKKKWAPYQPNER